MMSSKYTLEEVRSELLKEGYILLSDEYINSKTKLKTICPNGHLYNVSFDKWKSGRRCLCQTGKSRITFEKIKKCFEDRSYVLLSTECTSTKQYLDYICPNGHKHSIRADHFMNGHGCPYCAGRPVLNIKVIREEFEKDGYVLLTDEYINSSQKLYYICPNGHKHYITWANWKTGYRCPECAHTYKKNIEFIKHELGKEGYTLLTSAYINNKLKLHTLCPNGHEYFVAWSNWYSYGSRCPLCSQWGSSKQEDDLFEFVSSLCSNVIRHDRLLINPYELDLVIPDYNLAIEYCGLYWHSELAGKDDKYHLSKLEKCNSKGYRLITIFEDELLFNRDLVFSRLRHFTYTEIGKKIFARKCVVKELDANTARTFCNNNHIQGYGSGAKVKLGLFYNDELVSVMTFSKPSIAKGTRTNDETMWELHRFCSRTNTMVVGGASKLLSYFEKNYTWSKILTYADRRWSDGDVYDKLGFTFTGIIRPNYWYLSKQKRIHRYNLRKTSYDKTYLTEWELRKNQGWNRIWDCGNLRYIKVNN